MYKEKVVHADGFIDAGGHDLSSESFLPEPRARLSGQYCPRLTRDEEDRRSARTRFYFARAGGAADR